MGQTRRSPTRSRTSTGAGSTVSEFRPEKKDKEHLSRMPVEIPTLRLSAPVVRRRRESCSVFGPKFLLGPKRRPGRRDEMVGLRSATSSNHHGTEEEEAGIKASKAKSTGRSDSFVFFSSNHRGPDIDRAGAGQLSAAVRDGRRPLSPGDGRQPISRRNAFRQHPLIPFVSTSSATVTSRLRRRTSARGRPERCRLGTGRRSGASTTPSFRTNPSHLLPGLSSSASRQPSLGSGS